MYTMFFIAIFMNMLSFIVMSLSTALSKKMIDDREKSSPFECGFDPQSSSRIPFSLHFFLIAIIFLIFDVEITLILPMIMLINTSSIMAWLSTSTIFIIILLLGLYHEWNQKMLKWTL